MNFRKVPLVNELKPEDLYRSCDGKLFDFETTRDLEEPEGILGQPRAVAAVELGVGMERDGYNIFAFGMPGTGKREAVERTLRAEAAERPVPPDVCYVNDFEEDRKARLLRLPAGRGRELRRNMKRLAEELSTALRAGFESEEYQTRRQVIEETFEERQGKVVTELGEAAKEKGVALLRTPMGVVFAPLKDEEVLSPEEFNKLPAEEQSTLREQIEHFQTELQKMLRQLPAWQREKREKNQELERDVSAAAVESPIAELREHYRDLDGVLRFLDLVEKDILENAQSFFSQQGDKPDAALELLSGPGGFEKPFLRRYGVNVLVDHSESAGAPVAYEAHPTYPNLIGRVEHLSHMGTLVTDFNLIRPGTLHRANGGYLLIDALKLLTQPFAWAGLKRLLQSGEAKIESMGEALSVVSTYSLEPEPMPLEVKVVLLGEPREYYLLSAHDPDFPRLFKVAADFAERMERDPASELAYARLIASLVAREELRPFDRGAVARSIEHGARMVSDSERLTLNVSKLLDLLREADYWAAKAEHEVVVAGDVDQAIDAARFRSDRLRERVHEEILRGTILIDTDGERVGRINGLSVLHLGDVIFGQPSRISARVSLGKGEVVNIEREVDLSGPIHSKGALILAGFLRAHYAQERPLALRATVVFEQSYGGVDGDSASSTELYALLSAISGVPIRQSLAVTGSINQQGEIQAIGGANEKTEGYFDVCLARGLSGDQGVLIPASNVKHLMLRRDVVEAVAAGTFHVYPVATFEQGIEILTGVPAGERDAEGRFPEGTVNRLVEERLDAFARRARELAQPPDAAAAEESDDDGGGE